MSKKKLVLIIITFLIAITSIRVIWYEMQDADIRVKAVNGVYDLRGENLPLNRTIKLSGEWHFFPHQLLTNNSQTTQANSPETISIFKKWDKYFIESNQSHLNYGTYKLTILLDDSYRHQYKLKINEIRNASSIYINGKYVGGQGIPSSDEQQFQPRNKPYTVTIPHNLKTIEVFIQVTDYLEGGGITSPIRFGTIEAIDSQTALSNSAQAILILVLLLHLVYAILLCFIGTARKVAIHFSLLIFFAALGLSAMDNRILLNVLPLNYEAAAKVSYVSYIGIALFMTTLSQKLFAEINQPKSIYLYYGYCYLLMFCYIVIPLNMIKEYSSLLLISVGAISLYLTINVFRKALINLSDVLFLLLAAIAVGVNVFWATIKHNSYIEVIYYPFDLVIAILLFTMFWFRRYSYTLKNVQLLAKELKLEHKRKDDFLVNTAHELRNPLHVIVNIAQTIQQNSNNPLYDQNKNAEILISVSKRMALILEDLLDITRLKENTLKLKLASVHVESVVLMVFDILKFMLSGKNITLQSNIKENFPNVLADENRLVQILFNLIHNSIKFTNKGYITVNAYEEGDYAYISVKDTGIGIDDENVERIFQPYEQVEQNNFQSEGGFGLGLNICRQLVEMQGGSIIIQSILGEGTTVTFSLPINKTDKFNNNARKLTKEVTSEVAATIFPNEETIHQKKEIVKKKILLVDDDAINLTVLMNSMDQSIYQITAVTSGEEALQCLKNSYYDLVISDVMMPKMSGYELTTQIRKNYSISELPILLLTARSRPEDINTGFRVGANDYVTKPIDSYEFTVRVNALIELKESIQKQIQLEGAWLQAQISPHFLFNTLNSIAALGSMDVNRMNELLVEFGNYLRKSINFQNNEPLIPLERELSLVKSYLYIEKVRFGDRIKVHWNLDKNIDIKIPPLSLQTLVENAIKHGILPQSGSGDIFISIKDEGHYVKITVEDNGLGMNESILSNILTKHKTDDTGIGLKNTNRRLQQLFGQGLKVESSPNKGTKIMFNIPKSRE